MLRWILFKVSTLLTYISFPFARAPYKFFTRYFFINFFIQLKYFWKDYVIKKPYKIIQYDSEFGPELKYVVPFAYWHYKNGTLLKTISSKDTKAFYFFSPDHEERFDKRVWVDFKYDIEIPNSQDHSLMYLMSKWKQVPYKEFYRNDNFNFSKPILIIANRYNIEWDDKPISFLDFEILVELINILSEKFTIIYNRPESAKIINDNSEILELGEKDRLRKRFDDRIILMDDLFQTYACDYDNYNHFQLCAYASSKYFISVHGGTSVLASYFGGVNIIYSVKGHEHYCNEFTKFYPKLSGSKIYHAKDYAELLSFVSSVL